MPFDTFIEHVNEFRLQCLLELEKRKAGVPGESNIEQLEEIILPEMDALLALTPATLPPKEKRFLNSFVYAFKEWCWNMDIGQTTDLYDKLVTLHKEYKNVEESGLDD